MANTDSHVSLFMPVELRAELERSAAAVLPNGGAAISGYVNQGSAYRNAGWLAALATPDGQWKELPRPPAPCSYQDPYTIWMQADSVAVQEDGKLLVGGFGCSHGAVVGRFTPTLELDAGPPLTLAVESTDRRFARGTVRRGIAHLTGAVEASDDARVTVSVQRVNFKRPCIARATLLRFTLANTALRIAPDLLRCST